MQAISNSGDGVTAGTAEKKKERYHSTSFGSESNNIYLGIIMQILLIMYLIQTGSLYILFAYH